MGVDGQRHARSGRVRKISPHRSSIPGTLILLKCHFTSRSYAKLQAQFQGWYPGLRLGKIVISTAVNRCGEAGSVNGGDARHLCWLQINLNMCGVCMQQSPRKIFLRKLELKEQVSYFSTPEAVGKLCPCRNRGDHELLRLRQCVYDFLQLLYNRQL